MPEPSRLVLLEQLSAMQQGTKVRFLGCVQAYDGTTATLTLRDHHASGKQSAPSTSVNVENVLENINHELLMVGAWTNIIGTVRRTDVPSKAARSEGKPAHASWCVDATMIWSAGAIKLEDYRSAVQAYQKPLVSG